MKQARRAARLTQAQLAKESGVHAEWLSRLEHGHISGTGPRSRNHVRRVAARLGLDLDLDEPSTVPQAIEIDAKLSPEARGALLALYRFYTGDG